MFITNDTHPSDALLSSTPLAIDITFCKLTLHNPLLRMCEGTRPKQKGVGPSKPRLWHAIFGTAWIPRNTLDRAAFVEGGHVYVTCKPAVIMAANFRRYSQDVPSIIFRSCIMRFPAFSVNQSLGYFLYKFHNAISKHYFR